MSELVEFLRARLDEDERITDEAERLVDRDALFDILEQALGDGREAAKRAATHHMVTFRPSRILREVEAKRRIIDLHQEGVSNDFPPDEEPTADDITCMTCTPVGEPPFYPCSTLRLLALPYADHPDHRAEWAV